MSRDFVEPLKRFTPDASGLDRDALMFEAGRASAPSPARAWLLVGLLALTQALTVGFLLAPTPAPRTAPPAPPPASPSAGPPPAARLWQDRSEPVLPASEMTPDEPPMRLVDRHQFITLP